MVQIANELQDSHGDLNHKMDFPVGNREHGQLVQIDRTNAPLPVQYPIWQDPTRLAGIGRAYYASDADFNDTVTGTTTQANTTPSWLLDVPTGFTAIPLMFAANQTGTVAGGAITVIMEFDNAGRYSSGGTVETVFNARSGINLPNRCVLYSLPTATNAYGITPYRITVGEDVSPAEGAIQELLWTPDAGLVYLTGPAAWLVNTNAATTGPTWNWVFKWAEVPTSWLPLPGEG